MADHEGSLSEIQRRVLALLSGIAPGWVLTGGAALVLRAGHRVTRDLDLFWDDRDTIVDMSTVVRSSLTSAGLAVQVLQTTPTFVRLSVSNSAESTVVDLVASPASRISRPETAEVEGAEIAIDSEQELLVSKLCALLGRSEIRDLWDIQVLLDRGRSLQNALALAPQKDTGFSGPTLAWVLESMNVAALGRAVRLPTGKITELEAFRAVLVSELLAFSAPDG